MKKLGLLGVCSVALLLGGCAPEVGSKAWCDKMDEKPKGEWTMDDTGDYMKHCIFSDDDAEK